MPDPHPEASPAPVLSVVISIASDTTEARSAAALESALEALAHQLDPPSMEVLVPYRPPLDGIEAIQNRFPHVQLLPVTGLPSAPEPGGREHHDELRASAVSAARGRIIGLLEDHERADPRWSAAVVEAHRRRFAVIGGAIENAIDRPLNWAVYFCDFARYQNPVPDGQARFASDVNVSYKRSALESVRSVWRQRFSEQEVHAALLVQGEKLALSPRIVVYQHRSGLRLAASLRERFIWGRSYAAGRCRLIAPATRAALVLLCPALPALLLLRLAAGVFRKRRCRLAFLRALPLTLLQLISWSCGEWTGYATGRPGRTPVLHPAPNCSPAAPR